MSGFLPGSRIAFALCPVLALVSVMAWALGGVGEAPASPQPAERMVTDAIRVAVVDASTLRLADRVVRLEGVVPPQRGETCQNRDGLSFDCGVAAANALAAMLRAGTVDCTLISTDRNGHARGTCSSGGEQLNRAVVAQGWARASDGTLAAAEQNARAQQRGLWVSAR